MFQRLIDKVALYFLLRRSYSLPDIPAPENDLYNHLRPYTMTSPERFHAVLHAVRYVVRAGISGSLVECGVWKGGVMMGVARTLISLGEVDRELYLFDTFEGMPSPRAVDRDFKNRDAKKRFEAKKRSPDSSDWCAASIDEVRINIFSTGYPIEKIHFVQGKVENTIPANAPDKIAILRLDTDWYESTSHELIHLFPRLAPGGVLIIDDYGHWQGARQAVDEYFSSRDSLILLNRTDYTGRIGVKIK